MDSFLLLVLVAVLVLPVVLLWGFAGCEFHPPGPPILAPTSLHVTAITRNRITLTWADPNPGPNDYKVERTPDGGAPVELDAPETTFPDSPLAEDTTFLYRVRVASDDSDDTPFSTSVSAKTRTFEPAFTAVLTISQANLEGFTIIQRLEPLRLFKSGIEMRLTVRGSTLGDLTIDRIFISRVNPTGDPYDAAEDLTPVASNVLVPAGTPVTLPPIAYPFNREFPLLIAFDISNTPGQGNVIRLQPVAITEGAAYFRGPTAGIPPAEAAIPDRVPNATDPVSVYSPSDSIYIVERIDVA